MGVVVRIRQTRGARFSDEEDADAMNPSPSEGEGAAKRRVRVFVRVSLRLKQEQEEHPCKHTLIRPYGPPSPSEGEGTRRASAAERRSMRGEASKRT